MDLRPLPRDYWVHQIATMDPEVQWAEIYGITTGHEFPWDSQRATEIALVRTYAVPAIAELLAKTREFVDNTEKRYDDTAIILVESGNYISGQADDPTPIRRLNRMHNSYDIPNDQFLYVLATFVVMPRRWIDRYGYRSLTVAEVESMVRYWQRMGELMGIADVPWDYDGFADYLDTYEHERFGYSSSGRAISDATFDLVDSWYPAALRPLVRWAGIAMIDTPLRRALRYDDPPAIIAAGVEAALQVRKRVIKWLPARRDYVSPLDRLRLRTYPGGYDVAQVGTFPVRETQSS
jgi:hypothetical protein